KSSDGETPSPHPICRMAQPCGRACFSDDEVRFAKAVATPYLSHGTTLWSRMFLRRRGTLR
ncbi:MAG: hypothetical protein IJT83_15090, partial [Victivallales bacterium]|nr:hypothetical protein [Victivallales bacterium]